MSSVFYKKREVYKNVHLPFRDLSYELINLMTLVNRLLFLLHMIFYFSIKYSNILEYSSFSFSYEIRRLAGLEEGSPIAGIFVLG